MASASPSAENQLGLSKLYDNSALGAHAPAGNAVGEQEERFTARHLGPRSDQVVQMLASLGVDSLEELIAQVVPAGIRSTTPLALPEARSEAETLEALTEYANQNRVMTQMIGCGYYDTHTPTVILRNIMENPAWYTAYTPYQPEISQGRLEALVNFQTMVCDLTGLEIANSSMLDEATAAAEAMMMARRATKSASNTFLVDSGCNPQTVDVVRTRAEPLGIEVVLSAPDASWPDQDCFGALLAYPSSTGAVLDHRALVEQLNLAKVFVVVVADLLALCVLDAPGAWGADAVVGSAQRFGVPLGFGGPHAGFLATKEAHKRSMPGRLVGVSVDAHGRAAYRLALQTREQHIRREKATSNICTAQVLLAVMASMYAVYHGPNGLRDIATRTHSRAAALAAGCRRLGLTVCNDYFFDTVLLSTGGRSAALCAAAAEAGINIRVLDEDQIAISCDETTTAADLSTLLTAFGATEDLEVGAAPSAIPDSLRRSSEFLTHPIFNTHHSETELLRYLRRLADKDIALDRAMIPLGSCTMKLNATTEMIPVTLPGFGSIHPFAPADQTSGYRRLFADLESWLAEITGYDSVSLQPNAGSQGEYAGLLAIAAYHESRGEQRDVCLIPASAHGTNAASAVMVGMRVVVVACDTAGNVDLEDLSAKADKHSAELAALMITYPSTHGVFEEAIVEICEVIHSHGGQVYLDGANMNALVGLAKPGLIGSDVSHLNLHKTFCIPHGGGGPGVGPIGVKSHLAPFLPGHSVVQCSAADSPLGAVSAAPWGSASILPISWAYIALMGPDGLTEATRCAILSANYLATRLSTHFPILYTGANGRVAHECIIDIRPLEKATGISAEDIAKRLIDYGFHAPTMSFPVAGTLMIEPTESEPLAELDRFCDAMAAIRAEIDQVAAGVWTAEESPLRGAPHPAADVTANEWTRPYSRETAAYPIASLRQNKYWPPVSRIDNSYGDRNLVCSCPPPEAFASE